MSLNCGSDQAVPGEAGEFRRSPRSRRGSSLVSSGWMPVASLRGSHALQRHIARTCSHSRFELRDFSTTESTDNAYDLHAQADSGATLDWSGNFSLDALRFEGPLQVRAHQCEAGTGRLPARCGRDRSHVGPVLGFDGDYDRSGRQGGHRTQGRPCTISGSTDVGIKPIGQDANIAHLAKLTLSNANIDLAKHTAGVEKILDQWAAQSRPGARPMATST